MARIMTGFKERDRDAFTPQREAQREAGESAADNFDGPHGNHVRRIAIMR